ncbi:MAG: ornithine carbamoyltransferase, partial [Firmicutes bacterium]|nr:ornithine carbamoyltransferase [Bacillota bacterium]
MPVSLKGRSFLTLLDFSREEIRCLLDLSHDLKAKKRAGIRNRRLDGKNIVLLFEKTSTRTRCAFEVAAYDEGANVTYLDPAGSQMNKKESLEDTARVLGRFYDGIGYRGYAQATAEALAEYSGVPVFNALTDDDHPTQILADLMTVEERVRKPLRDVSVVFVGDCRFNMCMAWMIGCAKMGMKFTGLAPAELHPDAGFRAKIDGIAAQSGAKIAFTDNTDDIRPAEVVYTDIWASMGEEAQMPERVRLLSAYRLDAPLYGRLAAENAIFLHCLPSYHDMETTTAKDALALGIDIREVTDEVFRGPGSMVFDEAENRMHTIKAVLVA